METYTHEIGQDFKKLPEIYQIEVCSACNLECPMCLRTTHMGRHPGLVNIELLKLMHTRGDFRGSYYVELQMAGEPTLHRELAPIIDFLKDQVGVMVGLSTHGLNMSLPVMKALLKLDALTISVDSVDPETYHKMRYPAQIEDLWDNLARLFGYIDSSLLACQDELKLPFIELQLIHTAMFEGTGNVKALEEILKKRGWNKHVSIRTTGDCFVEMQERGIEHRRNDLCLNPFRSVSVAHNGDVVSCCYIFDPKKDQVNWYGNLYESSLAEIWNGERVETMRGLHRNNVMKDQCAKCYLKSPCEIHTNILSRLIRNR